MMLTFEKEKGTASKAVNNREVKNINVSFSLTLGREREAGFIMKCSLTSRPDSDGPIWDNGMT